MSCQTAVRGVDSQRGHGGAPLVYATFAIIDVHVPIGGTGVELHTNRWRKSKLDGGSQVGNGLRVKHRGQIIHHVLVGNVVTTIDLHDAARCCLPSSGHIRRCCPGRRPEWGRYAVAPREL